MKNNLFKKSIAVVMTALMLMSCWVFMPATHEHFEAEAAALESASSLYNKSLLNGIDTNVDYNVNTTGNYYKFKIYGNGDDGGDNTPARQQKYYKNLLSHDGDSSLVGDKNRGSYFNNVTNSELTVSIAYPTMVLKYDGVTTPKFGIMLEADSTSGKTVRFERAWMDANSNGLSFNPNYWLGIANDDSAYFYCMDVADHKYTLRAQDTNQGGVFNARKNGQWEFLAASLEFTDSMSIGEWTRTISPTWKFSNGSTTYTGTNTSTIYVMNFKGYGDLLTRINNHKNDLLANAGQYTTDSVKTYVEAAKAIINLNPKNYTGINQATSWGSQMNTAYANYTTAVNNLKNRQYEVTYDNMFSLADWRYSQSYEKSGVSVDLSAGKVTVKHPNSSGEYVTLHSGDGTTANTRNTTYYAMPVTEGKSYTLKYKTDHADTQMFAFFYASNGACVYDGSSYGVYNFSAKNGSGEATFSAPAGAAYMEIRFDNNTPSSTANYWDIMIYPAAVKANDVDNWTTRPHRTLYTYGASIGTLPTPVRPGYIFDGWKEDTDGDGIGDAAISGTVTKSRVLYSSWKPGTMDVGYDNLFSVAEWALAAGNDTTNRGGKITVDNDNGTISIENPAGADYDNNYVPWNYDITVKKNTDYVFVYNADYEAGGVQVHLFLNNGKDVSGSWGTFPDDCYIYEGTPSKVVTFNTGNYDNINVRLGTVAANGITNTFSNIGLYEKAAYDAYAKDYEKVREAFQVGEVKNFFKPTREGYEFEGWELADGTEITSTEDLTSNTTVYAVWAKLYKVTYYNGNGNVLDTATVKEGETVRSLPTTTPTKASTDTYGYKFENAWTANGKTFDTSTIITSDIDVEPVFTEKKHESFRFIFKSDATCLENAKAHKYCDDCGYYFGEVTYNPDGDVAADEHESWIAVGSHDFSGSITRDKDENATVHYVECTRCDATDAVAHSYDQKQISNTFKKDDASCTASAVYYYSCVCGAKGTETFTHGDFAAHTEVTVEGKAATCTATGLTEGKKCSVCGATTVSQTVIPELGHLDANKDHVCDRGCGIAQGTCSDSETDRDHLCDYGCGKVLEACTDKANDGDHKCDICDKDNVTEHIKGEETKENITEATCGSAGKYDSVYYCTECNAVVERINDVTIDQLPHTWQSATYSWSADGKSCTATRVCANNAAHTESETVNATGVQTVAPTCEGKGATLYTADFEATWAETQTNEVYDIPANNHTPAAAVIENNIPATCTTDGSYDTVIYCSVEGCNKQLSRVTTTVTATGHTAGAVVVENNTPATCTTDGSYDNVTYCTVCGIETSRETIVVPQKGHTAGAVVVENNVPESCTTDGSYDNATYCTVCGTETSRETIVVPQKGHTPGAEATCTTAQTCTVCGVVLVAALGHDWNDATCTTPKTCSVCDETEGEALGHDWADADCTTAKTCSVCGATEGEALGHDWADATCTAPKTCSVCGATEGEALGHDWADATCTTPKTCSVCGETEGEALGHTWNDATCTTAKTCSVCGETEGEALGHTWNDADCTTAKTCSVCGATDGDALGHTWNDADCTTAKTCSVCGATEGEALGHDWTDADCVTAKTCATCGATDGDALGHTWNDADCTTAKTCSVCGETEGEALGHTWNDADCTTAKTCSVCGETEGEALGHTWADATCTAPKTCSVCGATEGEALGHDWADANCTTPKTCSVCGETEGEALGHTWADATCTTPKTCSVCDATEGEALGHTWADATCTAPKTCSVCDATEGEALGHTWVDATCTTPKTCSVCDATEGKANGHAMTDFGYTVPTKVELPEDTVIAEPTCKKDGLAISYCETEGCTYYDTMVVARDKDAHNWSEETKGEGNCTTGVTFYTECSYCGTKTVTRVEVVPHELVLVAYEPANCTTEEIRYYVCSVCGYGEEEHIGEALGHDWAKDVIEKEATCGQTGRKYSICSRCNTASEKVEIPRLGHVWEEEGFNYAEYMAEHPNANILYVEASDATCTYEGYNGYYKCFSCSYDQHLDNEWRKDNVIAVKAHEDKDGDNKCDDCNAKLYGDDSNSACGCICHKENWFSKLIYKILCFFWKLFGIGKSCECGTVHY